MNLFDLFAKISLDTSDYDKGVEDASKSGESLNRRWNRFRKRVVGFVTGRGRGKRAAARGGVTVKPKAKKVVVSGAGAKSGGSDVQARIAAGKAAAAAKKEAAEKDGAAE